MSAMRKIYNMAKDEDQKPYLKMKHAGLKSAYKYSYETIGNLIKEKLNAN